MNGRDKECCLSSCLISKAVFTLKNVVVYFVFVKLTICEAAAYRYINSATICPSLKMYDVVIHVSNLVTRLVVAFRRFTLKSIVFTRLD